MVGVAAFGRSRKKKLQQQQEQSQQQQENNGAGLVGAIGEPSCSSGTTQKQRKQPQQPQVDDATSNDTSVMSFNNTIVCTNGSCTVCAKLPFRLRQFSHTWIDSGLCLFEGFYLSDDMFHERRPHYYRQTGVDELTAARTAKNASRCVRHFHKEYKRNEKDLKIIASGTASTAASSASTVASTRSASSVSTNGSNRMRSDPARAHRRLHATDSDSAVDNHGNGNNKGNNRNVADDEVLLPPPGVDGSAAVPLVEKTRILGPGIVTYSVAASSTIHTEDATADENGSTLNSTNHSGPGGGGIVTSSMAAAPPHHHQPNQSAQHGRSQSSPSGNNAITSGALLGLQGSAGQSSAAAGAASGSFAYHVSQQNQQAARYHVGGPGQRARVLAPLRKEELVLGARLGSGGFATVYEIDAFVLDESRLTNGASELHPSEMAARLYLQEHAQRTKSSDKNKSRKNMFGGSVNGSLRGDASTNTSGGPGPDYLAYYGASMHGASQNSNNRDDSPVKTRNAPERSSAAAWQYLPTCRYVVKHLKSSLIQDEEKFEKAAIDLALEAQLLRTIDHPNIVRLRGWTEHGTNAFTTGLADEFFLVLDCIPETLDDRFFTWRQSLRKYKSRSSTSTGAIYSWIFNKRKYIQKQIDLFYDRLHIARDIASAIEYLHSRRIIYRDLKASNIGIDYYGHVQLYDFGLARILPPLSRRVDESGYKMSCVGTRSTMAPEVKAKLPYDVSCDVYSYGVVLWEILSLSTSGEYLKRRMRKQQKEQRERNKNKKSREKHEQHQENEQDKGNNKETIGNNTTTIDDENANAEDPYAEEEYPKQCDTETERRRRREERERERREENDPYSIVKPLPPVGSDPNSGDAERDAHQETRLPLPICPCWPATLQDLVRNCLSYRPTDRPSMRRVRKEISKHIDEGANHAHATDCTGSRIRGQQEQQASKQLDHSQQQRKRSIVSKVCSSRIIQQPGDTSGTAVTQGSTRENVGSKHYHHGPAMSDIESTTHTHPESCTTATTKTPIRNAALRGSGTSLPGGVDSGGTTKTTATAMPTSRTIIATEVAVTASTHADHGGENHNDINNLAMIGSVSDHNLDLSHV